jgi:hypothetical protein
MLKECAIGEAVSHEWVAILANFVNDSSRIQGPKTKVPDKHCDIRPFDDLDIRPT